MSLVGMQWKLASDGGGVAPHTYAKVETATCEADHTAGRTAPTTVTDLDPVMVGEPLWVLQKDGHSAEARVRAIPNYGLELRSRSTASCITRIDSPRKRLEEAAKEKRHDFELRGWRA
jgi:hypothetical protein